MLALLDLRKMQPLKVETKNEDKKANHSKTPYEKEK